MTVAVAEATEAFQTVMEQTSFGPALWAAMQFDEVGRMACAGGQSQGDDERSQAVAGMARAELGAGRILALTDLELAMLRAHAAAPVVGPARAELLRRHPQLTPMTNESIKAAVRAFCVEDISAYTYSEDGVFGGWSFCDSSGASGGGGIMYEHNKTNFRRSPKAEAKYGPIRLWDVSEVTDMHDLFHSCTNFNENISAWDVQRVSGPQGLRGHVGHCPCGPCMFMSHGKPSSGGLSCMFNHASSFNQPLGAWTVQPCATIDHVYNRGIFRGATAFELPANAPWYTGENYWKQQ